MASKIIVTILVLTLLTFYSCSYQRFCVSSDGKGKVVSCDSIKCGKWN